MRRATVRLVAAFLVIVAPSLFGASRASAAPPQGDGAADRPNIIVILTDDLGPLDGRLWPRLPNIEGLFAQGVTFSDAHVESPLCCPGRAGFLTGLHTFNHGVVENDVRLRDDSMTIATQLDESGYYTFWAGKYLNEYDTIAPHVPPGWDRFHGAQGGYYDYSIWNNGDPDGEEHGRLAADYSTDVFRRKAVGDLRRAPPGQPVFGVVSVFGPHGPALAAPRHQNDPRCADVPPWAPPNYNEADVSDKPLYVSQLPLLPDPAWDLRKVCQALLSVDDLVGAVRAELTSQGRLRDTVFIFTADNGLNYGAHRLNGKRTPYSTQVPFVVGWPDRVGTSGRTVAERIMNIDLAPTLCELAGCRMGPYPNGQARADGESFAPLLLGTGDGAVRDATITDMPAPGKLPSWHAVTTSRWSDLASVGCQAASRDGCLWRYVEYGTGEHELYDLSNGPCWTWKPGRPGDPCELENVAGGPKYAAVEAALRVRLEQLKREGGFPGG